MAGGYITEIRENELITDYNQNGTWTNLNNWHIDASQVRKVFDRAVTFLMLGVPFEKHLVN